MSKAIAITYHSDLKNITENVDAFLKSNNFETFLISENEPESLSIRSRALISCNILIAIISRNFQRTVPCMETVHYAKDLKKKILFLNSNPSFIPFGALGAIAANNVQIKVTDGQKNFDEILQNLNENLQNRPNSARPKSSKSFHEIINKDLSKDGIILQATNKQVDVLVSYHPEAKNNAEIVAEGLQLNSIEYSIEDSSNKCSSVDTCKVLIVIMSPSYEANDYCRGVVEKARSLNKEIIPISITKSWQPQEWLGLVIAGKLFYRIIDRDNANKQIYDSTSLNIVVYGVKAALLDRPSEIDREIARINVLKDQIEEAKLKLPKWPPKQKQVQKNIKKPVKVVLDEPKATCEFNHIHYDVTRMTFQPPKPLYDPHGVPIRQKFDCMISYQWDYQNLVRNVYMDLHMKSLSIWFDIWGGMEGNTNDAMATAIECSKVIVVFLSDAYQKSINCKLEFKYAAVCGKPFIFIIVEPDLQVADWVLPYYNESPKFEIKSLEDEGILHNGVPRIDVIAQAIRKIGLAQPDDDIYELSEDVFNLMQLLNDALDEITENSGIERYKTCSRCKKKFDDNNLIGCKYHTAYYLGGSLIEGRWVCCNQQSKDSIGCRDANHTDVERTWTFDSYYGTYTWVPA